jgi:hypothetical protein
MKRSRLPFGRYTISKGNIFMPTEICSEHGRNFLLKKMPEYEFDFQPVFEVTPSRFLIRATSFDGRSVWKITEDSRVWRE